MKDFILCLPLLIFVITALKVNRRLHDHKEAARRNELNLQIYLRSLRDEDTDAE